MQSQNEYVSARGAISAEGGSRGVRNVIRVRGGRSILYRFDVLTIKWKAIGQSDCDKEDFNKMHCGTWMSHKFAMGSRKVELSHEPNWLDAGLATFIDIF